MKFQSNRDSSWRTSTRIETSSPVNSSAPSLTNSAHSFVDILFVLTNLVKRRLHLHRAFGQLSQPNDKKLGQRLWLSWLSGLFRGSRFKSIHRQHFILNNHCQLYWKDKNKEKEAGNSPFFKNKRQKAVPFYFGQKSFGVLLCKMFCYLVSGFVTPKRLNKILKKSPKYFL